MAAAPVVAPAMGKAQIGEITGATSRAGYEVIDCGLPRAGGQRVDRGTAQPAPPTISLGDPGELH